MDNQAQGKALEAFKDWSRWLVGVNVVAAGGCVAVLQTGVGGIARLFLMAAIGAFIAAVLVAAALLGLLPGLIQQVPVKDASGKPLNIFDLAIWSSVKLRTVAQFQFFMMVLAGLFFLGWVLLKPSG